MRIDVVTLFPELVEAVADTGVTSRAKAAGILQLQCWNPRDYTQDKHRTVDDKPYGGGPGMLMKYEPLHEAIVAAKSASMEQEGVEPLVIYMSPQGKRLDQQAINRLANHNLVLIAGRYEGVDERLIIADVDEEWSLGDYVLSGGELAAMVVIDATTRLQSEALGDEQSAQQDSFMHGLLDHPHYTRPECIADMNVPEVLTGGHHTDIQRWRDKQSLGRTWERRPDLLENLSLTDEQQVLLQEYIREFELLNKQNTSK
jgi:tRNA (guanine37-N1)-methyltransferase